MILNLDTIKTIGIPLLRTIKDSFIFLDVRESCIYTSDTIQALKIAVDLSDPITEDSLVINRLQFLNVITYALDNSLSNLAITGDNGYSIGNFNGVFETNSNLKEVVEAIKLYFDEAPTELFSITQDNKSILVNAKKYTSERTNNFYIKNNTLATSAQIEIFLSAFTSNDCILPADFMSTILDSRLIDGSVNMTDSGFIFKKDCVSLFYSLSSSQSFIPVFSQDDAVITMLNNLAKDENALNVSIESLLSALNYLKVYFSNLINRKIQVALSGDTLTLSVDESKIEIEVDNSNKASFSFFANADNITKALSLKRGKEETTITLFSSDNIVPFAFKDVSNTIILTKITR